MDTQLQLDMPEDFLIKFLQNLTRIGAVFFARVEPVLKLVFPKTSISKKEHMFEILYSPDNFTTSPVQSACNMI